MTAEATDNAASGIIIRLRGRKSPHATPSNSPNVTPILDIIESFANADGHPDLGCVSMINRFSGVAEAEEKNDMIA